jgi:hypothetical protein
MFQNFESYCVKIFVNYVQEISASEINGMVYTVKLL